MCYKLFPCSDDFIILTFLEYLKWLSVHKPECCKYVTIIIAFSQKASIDELKTGLDEERNQRREDREIAIAEIKTAVHRCQIEAQEELKRFSDAAMRHEREQQEVINKMKV